MSSSYMNSSGSCLLPQLPPLPPPPFANQLQPSQWSSGFNSFGGSPSFIPLPTPPLPPSYFSTTTTPIPPSLPGHFSHQASAVSLLPSPLYGNSQAASFRGRGRRGNGGKWKIQKCETCDRVYKSEETFAEHLQSHVKCSQCDFTALPKKVKEHSQVHSLPDFLDFSSPDDIKKWREDRKRNYPSVSNVAKKKKLEEQRKMRGQMIDTPLYRYVNQLIGDYDSRRGRGRGRSRGRGRGNYRGRGQRYNHQLSLPGSNKEEQLSTVNNDQSSSHPSTSNDDNDDHTPSIDVSTDTLSDKGINDHTHSGDTIQTPSDHTPSTSEIHSSHNTRKGQSKWQRSSKSRNGHHNVSTTNKRQSTQCHWTQLSLSKRPTLLEKLLASSIKSEHNAILQCVRYTVQNGFFNVESPSQPPVVTDDVNKTQI